MRIWDIDPACLCRQHLLGEHRELHALWNILTQDKKGYRNHPETQRWVGKLGALRQRHEQLVAEMDRRGYIHRTPLPEAPDNTTLQDTFINTPEQQIELLRQKACQCPLDTLVL